MKLNNLLVYDVETYIDIFSLVGFHVPTGNFVEFEISDRRNDSQQLAAFLQACMRYNVYQVGYNNIGFDYPILHEFIIRYPHCTSRDLQAKADWIINGKRGKFDHLIKPWEVKIKQIDLMKLWHNDRRGVGLKVLEFAMRAQSIEDLPFDPKYPVGVENYDKLLKYNKWDVIQTCEFLKHSYELLGIREKMGGLLGKEILSQSNTKMGETIFVNYLEKQKKGICYNEKRKPRQTHRPQIHLRDAILPYIQFETTPFQSVLDFFRSTTITNTKGEVKHPVTVNGFEYTFGTGGIHASVNNRKIYSNDEYVIIDYDVTSFYPKLSIENTIYPEHLGSNFCIAYNEIFKTRAIEKKKNKGGPLDKAYKEALNASYGLSNSKYSPLYDPLFTMTITVSGQLSLAMLAEQLIKIPNCSMVQMNTDGLTIHCPRQYSDHADNIIKQWEQITNLNMERVDYSAMLIRDVNAYIAVTVDGDIKRKGPYAYGDDLEWHKDHGGQVIAKVAERVMLNGGDPLTHLINHDDRLDFMLLAKVGKSSKLYHGDEQIQNISRYLVTNGGKPLCKLMPPLKDKTESRPIRINAGHNATVYNDVTNLNRLVDLDIDYDFYLAEIKKLIL